MDEDVITEREHIENNKLSNKVAVIINNLKKSYPGEKKCCKKPTNEQMAVKGMHLTIEEDTLLCLLGHNGAGKVKYNKNKNKNKINNK